jgi:hypothetical protein
MTAKLGGVHAMPMAERNEKLRVARDRLVPVLMLLDDCEEHHVAAIVSTALDTLQAKLDARQGPFGA